MTPVFLDTVGLIAIWDEDDQWHSRASDRAFTLSWGFGVDSGQWALRVVRRLLLGL